jgi:beta-lactamase class A
MTFVLTRRAFGLVSTGIVSAALSPAQAKPLPLTHAFAALESRYGGKLGVAALDTSSEGRISHNATERFPMCSAHKLLTAAAVLAMVDQGTLTLDQTVPYGKADILDYAPITKKNVSAGFMTVGALCAAAIEWSDNTAENLLLGLIGGPPGWTHYARSIGDTTSRLDRIEPDLNTAIPGDPRDTTTPNAMVASLNAVLLGTKLSKASRTTLQTWLLDSQIDQHLMHAGLPSNSRIGDKSGSGAYGTRNDVGIIFPPNSKPIIATVFYTGSLEPLVARETVIANVGRLIAQTFRV